MKKREEWKEENSRKKCVQIGRGTREDISLGWRGSKVMGAKTYGGAWKLEPWS